MKTDLDFAKVHKYRLEHDGPIVPGVTTIISVIEKPGLKWSASGIAAETAIKNSRRKRTIVPNHRTALSLARGNSESAITKRGLATFGTDNEVYAHWCRGEFDRQWRAKADRGNRVHDIAEAFTRGQDVEVLEGDKGYVEAWERFYEDYRPNFHFTEFIVGGHSPTVTGHLPYGGRPDFIGELSFKGSEGMFLCDYKTGKEYTDSVALQTIGYVAADFIDFDVEGNITGRSPLPGLKGARAIYLHEDGTYKVVDPFEKITEHAAWKAFSACNTLYTTMKQINEVLGKEENV